MTATYQTIKIILYMRFATFLVARALIGAQLLHIMGWRIDCIHLWAARSLG